MFRHYRVILRELVINTLPSYTVQYRLVFVCTTTNQCTIISQIITLLHVSTLSCHPQGTCNQYVAKLQQYISNAAAGNTVYNLYVSRRLYGVSHIIVAEISIL